MTVVVGMAAPDGIVLAAESRTTSMFDTGRHRILSDTAQKVFAICETIGVATYGDAFVGPRTIAGLMDEFVAQLPPPDEVPRECDAVADAMAQFFDQRFRSEAPADLLEWCEQNRTFPLGFLVAGYDSDGIGRLREIGIPGPKWELEIDTATRGGCWRGQTDVIRRLIKGFDGDGFVGLGHTLPDDLVEPIAQLEYVFQHPVTLQDAVDVSTFLIRTTIDMQRFSDGIMGSPGSVPGCGGAIRVLSVTPNGAEWVALPALTADGLAGLAEEGRAP
jgi:hypothetical protein